MNVKRFLIGGKKGLVGRSLHDDYLMQSTGLVDRHGVEIFEGDILSRDNAEVYYDDEFAEWRVRGSGKGITTTSLYCWIDCEVIGNIYDNPELVEG